MTLTINTNLASLTASNNMQQTYNSIEKSVARLSSGLRISSGGDDPAGLAVRELMRADIAVLNQGVRNGNDAISMLETMDGATGSLNEKLIRMKELAQQAATETYSTAQRSVMQLEFDAMRTEIDRIANATEFNEIKMLNATSGGVAQALALAADNGIGTNSGAAVVDYLTSYGSGDTLTAVLSDNAGSAHTTTVAITSSLTFANLISSLNAGLSADATVSWSSAEQILVTDTTSGVSSLDLQFMDNSGNQAYDFSVETEGVAGEVTVHFGLGVVENNDWITIEKFDLTASGLSLASLNIETSITAARDALSNIDQAINTVDEARASLGANLKVLESTVSHLAVQSENLQGAESEISDVDVAMEMTNFTSSQVKLQAAVSMLSHANMLPQMALKLLE